MVNYLRMERCPEGGKRGINMGNTVQIKVP